MFPVQPVLSPGFVFWGQYLLLGKVGVVCGYEPSLESKTIYKQVIDFLHCQNWQEEEKF